MSVHLFVYLSVHPCIIYSSIFQVYCVSGLLTPLAKYGIAKQPVGFQSQRNGVPNLAPCLGLSLLSLHLVTSGTGTVCPVLPALPCDAGGQGLLQHSLPSGLQGVPHGSLPPLIPPVSPPQIHPLVPYSALSSILHPACVILLNLAPAFHRTCLLVSLGSCSSTCPKLNSHLSLQAPSSSCLCLWELGVAPQPPTQ